jgi:Spy/CpxP family protein refolding chaperone
MNRLPRFAVLSIAGVLAFAPLSAQTSQPHSGLETRPIKALSAEQIADLKAGRGMGLALVAELNGYVGPVHVLELADSLHLAADQRAKMEELFAAMKAEAIPLGEVLIAQESDLDRQFADRTITEASLAAATQAIGSTRAALRAAHLKYHLAATEVLAPMQIQRYAELRGYTSEIPAEHPHTGHQH